MKIILLFHLIVNNMQLSVWRHYIQFTLKNIILMYMIFNKKSF